METYKEECESKSVTINKLQKRIGELEKLINLKNREINICVKAKQEAEAQLNPVKESLNNMTAAHGKLLRKLKRNCHGK